MRYQTLNPFIHHECVRLELAQAPIQTQMYESYAQCNEDLVIEPLLRALMRRAGREMRSVRYMEIGANHPVQTSATYLLNRLHGAAGVLVEANPKLIANLRRARPLDVVLNCAVVAGDEETVEMFIHEKDELSSMSKDHIDIFQGFGGSGRIVDRVSVPAMNINALMRAHGGERLDFLSVDVEGYDLPLLARMDPVFQPSLIQCEHEQQFDAFQTLLGARGYRLAAETDVNLIFAKAGLF